MADDGRHFDASEDAGRQGLGDQLDLLLDQFVTAGLHVGVRERSAAVVVCARWMEGQSARGEEIALYGLRPVLAPLIARTREERATYFEVFDRFNPLPTGGVTAVVEETSPQRKRRLFIAVLVGSLLIGAAALGIGLSLTPPPQKIAQPELAETSPAAAVTDVAPPVAPGATPFVQRKSIQTSSRLLERISAGGRDHDFAPTLKEIAASVSSDSESLIGLELDENSGVSGWTVDAYAERLHQLTGLPRDTPLPLFGLGKPDGAVWARLAQALGRIEGPGSEPPLSELEVMANAALVAVPRERVYRIADKLIANGDMAAPSRRLVEQLGTDPLIGEGPASEVERGLVIAGRQRLEDSRAPWTEGQIRQASAPPPTWLPWLGIVPAFVGLWFAHALAIRKPYLRRRAPLAPPLHTDLVSDARRRVAFSAATFQRAGQRLLTRLQRASDRIDVVGTIEATLRSGGYLVQPVYAGTRTRPDYLVLIERSSTGDHEARRLRQMVERLQTLVDVDVFYFQTDPAELESEDGSRRITLEQAQSTFPEHRLIVLGACVGFLDPVSFEPRLPARKLLHWERRAVLTPVPLAEWGREEFALAAALDTAVGRATPEGLLQLAEYLGLEGAESKARLGFNGDNAARPMPEILRLRPQRFLFNADPGESARDEVLRELRNYLDPSAFDWFASLAVYPAVQWDLTLYLGVELPRIAGANAETDPLYDEARLAAITQLPWMKAGRMPNWLRRALIEKLGPRRVREVKAAIEKIIRASQLHRDQPDPALMLRVGKEPPKEGRAPDRLLDDEVLVDFLANGRREDLALPPIARMREWFDRSFWKSLGGPEGIGGAAALAYAITAFNLAPRSEVAATGSYAPFLTAMLGGALLLGLWLIWKRRIAVLRVSERAAPLALTLSVSAAFFFFAWVVAAPQLAALGLGGEPGMWTARPLAVVPVLLASLAHIPIVFLSLLLARTLSGRVGIRIFARPLLSAGGWVAVLIKTIAISVWLAAFWIVAGFPPPTAIIAIGLGVCAVLLVVGGFAAHTSQRFSAAASPGEAPVPVWVRVLGGLVLAVPLGLAVFLHIELQSAHSRWDLNAANTAAAVHADVILTALSPDDKTLAVAERNGAIHLRSIKGDPLASIDASRTGFPSALAVTGNPGAHRVAWADGQGEVKEWREDTGSAQSVVNPGTAGPLRSSGAPALLVYDANNHLLVAVEIDGATAVFGTGSNAMLPLEYGPPTAVASGEDLVAVATLNGMIHTLRPQAGSDKFAIETVTGSQKLAPAHSMWFERLDDGRAAALRLVLVDGSLVEAVVKDAKIQPPTKVRDFANLALGKPPEYDFRVNDNIYDAPPEGVNPDFDRATAFVLAFVQGFVADRKDPGQSSNARVFQADYDAYRAAQKLPTQSVEDISDMEVRAIYWAGVWKPGQFDRLDSYAIKVILLDSTMLEGFETAADILHTALDLPARLGQPIGAEDFVAMDRAASSGQRDLVPKRLIEVRANLYYALSEERPDDRDLVDILITRLNFLSIEAGLGKLPSKPAPATVNDRVLERVPVPSTETASTVPAPPVEEPPPAKVEPPPPTLPPAETTVAQLEDWNTLQEREARTLLPSATAFDPPGIQTIMMGPGDLRYDGPLSKDYPSGVRIVLKAGSYDYFSLPKAPTVIIEGPRVTGKTRAAILKSVSTPKEQQTLLLSDITIESAIFLDSGLHATFRRVRISGPVYVGVTKLDASQPARPRTEVAIVDSQLAPKSEDGVGGRAISVSGTSTVVIWNTTITGEQRNSDIGLGLMSVTDAARLTIFDSRLTSDAQMFSAYFKKEEANKGGLIVKNSTLKFDRAILSSKYVSGATSGTERAILESNTVHLPKTYETEYQFLTLLSLLREKPNKIIATR